MRADAARPVQSSEAPAATEAAGTVVALALDPVLASYKAQLERETARDFAGAALRRRRRRHRERRRRRGRRRRHRGVVLRRRGRRV